MFTFKSNEHDYVKSLPGVEASFSVSDIFGFTKMLCTHIAQYDSLAIYPKRT
jgi:hypothetical protein